MLLTSCANSSTMARKQFQEAELFADDYAKSLREAGFIWSEYPPESYYDRAITSSNE